MIFFFHLVFPQNFFEMNQFTKNSSFQVSENLRYTLQTEYIPICTLARQRLDLHSSTYYNRKLHYGMRIYDQIHLQYNVRKCIGMFHHIHYNSNRFIIHAIPLLATTVLPYLKQHHHTHSISLAVLESARCDCAFADTYRLSQGCQTIFR